MLGTSSEIVIFAIRAGLRLGQQVRQAYVDSTKKRSLTLPLPNIAADGGFSAAVNFFAYDGAEFVVEGSAFEAVFKRAADATVPLSEPDEQQVVEYYCKCVGFKQLRQENPPGAVFDTQAFTAFWTIEQWQQGTETDPSALQRVVGTLVEIGIDYFASGPGRLDKGTREGRVVAGVVEALDDITFSEISLDESGLREIAGRLFIAALDTVSNEPALVAGDARIQELVKVVTGTMARDVAVRINQLRTSEGSDSVKEGRIKDWGELVFRSVLSSAGRAVIDDPARYLGVEDDRQGAIITNVGRAVLAVGLEHEGVQLERVFGRDGLDAVVRASLATVSQHPDLLVRANDRGLQAILAGLARRLSETDAELFELGVFPELARLVLEQTGRHLEQVWPEMAQTPENHLLLTAVQKTLEVLTTPAGAATWKPKLTGDDLLAVTETVLDELADNPAWLIALAEDADANLGAALKATMQVLRQQDDRLLSRPVAVRVLQSSIEAVGRRCELLTKYAGTRGRPIVAAAVNAVLAAVFDDQVAPEVRWQLLRSEAVTAAVSVTLDRLAGVGVDGKTMKTLKEVLSHHLEAVGAGEPVDWEDFGVELETRLRAA